MNEEEERLPLFTRLNDAIDKSINQFGEFVADAAEDKEGWTDDAVRGTLGGLQWLGNLPVLKQIGQLEEGLVSGVRNLAERQDFIDPRSFTYTTRVGTAFIPYTGAVKTVGKLSKVSKAARLARGARKAFKQGNITMGLPSKGARIPDLLGDSSKVRKPVEGWPGGLQEQFTPEGLKGALLQQLDNPDMNNWISKFGTKIAKQIQKAVGQTKGGVQLTLGREADNIKTLPGFEIFRLDPYGPEGKRILFEGFARKSGYRNWADYKKNVINQYPDPYAQEELLYKFLKEYPGVGQVEHKIAKASKIARRDAIQREFPDLNQQQLMAELAERSKNTFDMDWYWNKEYIGRDGKWYTNGLNKGDRDSLLNTLPDFNTRQIRLKNIVEQIGYGGEGKKGYMLAGQSGRKVERVGKEPGILWQATDPGKRLIVSVKVKNPKAGLQKQVGQFGNITIQRAKDNLIIGEIGAYMDALYPADPRIKRLLEIALNQRGYRGPRGIAQWRREQILKRLETIVRDAPNLPAKSNKAARRQAILRGLEDDMVDLFEEFEFLEPQFLNKLKEDMTSYPDMFDTYDTGYI